MKTKYSLCLLVIAMIVLGVLPQSSYGQEIGQGTRQESRSRKAAVASQKSKDGDVRDWNLADGSKETGELESVEVIIRLPSGETKSVPFQNILRADQRFVVHWLVTDKDAKPIAPGNAKPAAPAIAKPAAKPIARKPGLQKVTEFGDVKLTAPDIQIFLEKCQAQKQNSLEEFRRLINIEAESKNITPQTVKEHTDLYKFLSQPNVVIVLRDAWFRDGDGIIAKHDTRGWLWEQENIAETLRVIDNRTALVLLGGLGGGKVILEGVDTSQIPAGSKWHSLFILRTNGKRKIPAALGETEVPVCQAISDVGFPKDVILW